MHSTVWCTNTWDVKDNYQFNLCYFQKSGLYTLVTVSSEETSYTVYKIGADLKDLALCRHVPGYTFPILIRENWTDDPFSL